MCFVLFCTFVFLVKERAVGLFQTFISTRYSHLEMNGSFDSKTIRIVTEILRMVANSI